MTHLKHNVFARALGALVGLLALFSGATAAWAAPVVGPSVTSLIPVSSQRSGHTTYDLGYRIVVSNGTPALAGASATVVSSSAAIVVLQGVVGLGNLAANSTTTSVNTFTIRVDRTVPFDQSKLSWTFSGTPQVTVPAVVNLTQAAATAAITGAGLVLGSVTTAPSNTVGAGSVISQNPASGASVASGSAVNIVVSSGSANVIVPNVVGLTQGSAATAITGAGLVVGSVTTSPSNTVPAGSVISQNPVSGASVASGSAVNIVVSSGSANAIVPNVVGLTQGAAATAITGAGLVVGSVTTSPSNTVPSGSVISQNPVSGASVASGSAVNIVVSSGSASVIVPNVVGLTQGAAATVITGAGLVLGSVTTAPSNTVAAGSVISQNPVSGASVASGSAVNIVVATGPASVAVPDVVGLTQAAAFTAINGAGLVVGSVTTASSNTVPAGSVISQNPASGASVALGSAVNIVVSSGSANVNVPNVVGLAQAAATSAITGAGLVLGTVTSASSSAVPAGSVISQNPASGASVAPGSAVNIVVSTGPANGGGPLPGDPSGNAVGALTLLDPTPADPANIDPNRFILTRIDLVIDPNATIGQINAAINSVGGSIASMEPGIPELTITVPPAANVDALSALVAALVSMPGILDATPGSIPALKSWPSTPSAAPNGNLQHLAASRSLAASNTAFHLQAACTCVGAACPTVFVLDAFNTTVAAHQPADFATRMPGIAVPGPDESPPFPPGNFFSHGNKVAMVLGAKFKPGDDANNVMLGENPLSNCRNLVLIPANGLSGGQSRQLLSHTVFAYLDAHPGASAILSTSLGYNDQCINNNCSTTGLANLNAAIPSGYSRAIDALMWRGRMNRISPVNGDAYWKHMFIAVAAGNEANLQSTQLYGGAGTGVTDWWLTLAPVTTPLAGYATDASLWVPPAGLGYPNKVATAAQVTQLNVLEGLAAYRSYSGNTFIVGALNAPVAPANEPAGPFPPWDDYIANQRPTNFSDVFRSNAGDTFGIYAVGQDVLLSCPGNVCAYGGNDVNGNGFFGNGTSFATPQVAGLASLLWSIDFRIAGGLGLTPLYQRPASETLSLIQATADKVPASVVNVGQAQPKGKSIDALAAVLSLDNPLPVTPSNAPVRFALLDVNGDGQFDAADVQLFASHYFQTDPVSGALTTTPKVVQKDATTHLQPPPDYEYFDLNGDGYTGVFARTPFDLDPSAPVASAQRGAPNLGLVSVTGPSGQTLEFDENQVSDLDVMCYYAYAPGFFNTASDPTGTIRAQLGCGVQILALTGRDAAPGLTGAFSAFDSKVSVNNSGAIAFSGTDSAGATSGFVVTGPAQIKNVTNLGISAVGVGGASLNDATPVAQAAFNERIPGGSSPSFMVVRANADGSGVTQVAKTTAALNVGFCLAGDNQNQSCRTNTDCPIHNTDGVLTGFATCRYRATAPFYSTEVYLDMNDNGVVAIPALVQDTAGNVNNKALYAGTFQTDLTNTDLVRLEYITAGSTVLIQPQIANTGDVVYRDNLQNIKLGNFPTGGAASIVSPAATCANPSQRPGISRDGVFVAFAGDCVASPAGPVIQLIGRMLPVLPPLVAGNTSFVAVDTLGDPATRQGQFTSFSRTTRAAVASSVTPGNDAYVVTVVFAGTRSYTSGGVLHANVTGLYRATVSLHRDSVTGNWVSTRTPPRKIIEVGDVLGGHTVLSFDLWDPISQSGNAIGFWLTFTDGTQAVARAN